MQVSQTVCIAHPVQGMLKRCSEKLNKEHADAKSALRGHAATSIQQGEPRLSLQSPSGSCCLRDTQGIGQKAPASSGITHSFMPMLHVL